MGEYILKTVSCKFTRSFPDLSPHLELRNVEEALGYSLACFLCLLYSPRDHRVNYVPKKYVLCMRASVDKRESYVKITFCAAAEAVCAWVCWLILR